MEVIEINSSKSIRDLSRSESNKGRIYEFVRSFLSCTRLIAIIQGYYNRLRKRPAVSSEVAHRLDRKVFPLQPLLGYKVDDEFESWIEPQCLETPEESLLLYILPDNYTEFVVYIDGEPQVLLRLGSESNSL